MAEKDIQGKLLESEPEVFSDIVNVLNFRGAHIVNPDSLQEGPTSSVYLSADGRPREQIRDVTRYCTSLGAVIMLLGIENQSDIDYDMVFRVMRYDGASYQMQKDSREKYPVITTVLYFGMKRWDGPKSIREAISKDIPDWSSVIEAVPDYRINLVEVAFLPKEVREQFVSDFRVISEYFYAVREGKLEEFYHSPEAHMRISHVDEVMDFLRVFRKDDRYARIRAELSKKDGKGDDVTMCELLDYAEQKGQEKGLSQGVEAGIQALIEASCEFGQTYRATLEKVMDKFSLNPEEAEAKMKCYWKS